MIPDYTHIMPIGSFLGGTFHFKFLVYIVLTWKVPDLYTSLCGHH